MQIKENFCHLLREIPISQLILHYTPFFTHEKHAIPSPYLVTFKSLFKYSPFLGSLPFMVTNLLEDPSCSPWLTSIYTIFSSITSTLFKVSTELFSPCLYSPIDFPYMFLSHLLKHITNYRRISKCLNI